MTTADQAVGTYAYMAPELLYGSANATPGSDVFSLGVTFFQLLSGMRPFERPGSPVLIPSLCALRPDVDPKLNALIYQMISHSPEARPASMAAVEAQVAAYIDQSDLCSLVAEYYRWNNRSLPFARSRATPATPVPPPLPAEPTVSLVHAQPHKLGGTPNRRQRAFLLGKISGVLASVLCLCLLAVVMLHKPDEPLPPPPPPPFGTVLLTPHGDVAKQMLEEGKVNAKSKDRTVTLKSGENDLPPGTYTLEFDSPEPLEQEGKEFEVTESTRPMALYATLTRPFQYPKVPAEPHSRVLYYGNINQNPADSAVEVPFEMSLQVLPPTTVSGLKWLKVHTKHLDDPDNLEETAYLQLMDDDEFPLKFREGYIQSRSRSIAKYLRQRNDYEGQDSLVLPFNPDEDWLASANIADLPKYRISIHDFLTLFFGVTDLNAASPSLISLRNQLAKSEGRDGSERRETWLEDVHNGTGLQPCYMTSSRLKGKPLSENGYSLARRDAELYGFVRLEARHPNLTASCRLKIPGGPSKVDSSRAAELAKKELEQVIAARVDPTTLKPAPDPTPEEPKDVLPPEFANRPFDLALLSAEPSTVVWEGSVTRGDREELLDVRISHYETDKEQGLSWLELDVSSDDGDQRHTEYALLAIDAEKYRNTHIFEIKKGWIAFDERENVFVFPSDGDIDSLADERLQLKTETSFNHIGIVDILAMSFDAKLQPESEIGKLRKRAAGTFAGADRTLKPEPRMTKMGPMDGYVWNRRGLVAYEFFVSPKVPFGFLSVTLDVQIPPQRVKVDLQAVRYGNFTSDSTTIFGTTDQLAKAVANNRRRVATNATDNWRTWSWKQAGKAFKTYGEFGGQYDVGSVNKVVQYVVVANQDGQFIRIPRSLLSDEDRDFIDQGRVWSLPVPKKQHILVQDNQQTEKVTLRPVNAPNVRARIWQMNDLHPLDQAWLRRLRAAQALPVEAKLREEWGDFVGYTRVVAN